MDEGGFQNSPTDGGRVKKCANGWRKSTKMRQRLEGGLKNAKKHVVAKHALPVVCGFHEEPSLCCVLYREGGKNKVGLPETVGICKIVSSRTNIMFTLFAFKMYSIQKHGIPEISAQKQCTSCL
jgi:hypothetical protein